MLLNFILPEDSKVENVEEDDKFDEDFQDPKKETAADAEAWVMMSGNKYVCDKSWYITHNYVHIVG